MFVLSPCLLPTTSHKSPASGSSPLAVACIDAVEPNLLGERVAVDAHDLGGEIQFSTRLLKGTQDKELFKLGQRPRARGFPLLTISSMAQSNASLIRGCWGGTPLVAAPFSSTFMSPYLVFAQTTVRRLSHILSQTYPENRLEPCGRLLARCSRKSPPTVTAPADRSG